MDAKIAPRVITALLVLPLLVYVIGWGGHWLFSLLVFVITAGALCEYFFMAFPGRWKERIFGILFGILVASSVLIPGVSEASAHLSAVIVLVFSLYLLFGERLGNRYQHLGWTLLGILYIGFLVPHFAVLYYLPQGREWIFFVLLVVMAGDTAAYFVGSSLGRRKLAPEISPAKTVEGSLAFIAACLLAGSLGARFLLPERPALEALGLSLIFSILGQAGDLFESWIKRVFSVKDSAAYLPGHGGLLDRLDSLIFPVVFTTFYLRLVHP